MFVHFEGRDLHDHKPSMAYSSHADGTVHGSGSLPVRSEPGSSNRVPGLSFPRVVRSPAHEAKLDQSSLEIISSQVYYTIIDQKFRFKGMPYLPNILYGTIRFTSRSGIIENKIIKGVIAWEPG